MADNQVDLKLNLDFKGVNDALYQMIGDFKGTDKEFEKIAASIQKNANKLEAAILVFGPASKQAASAQKALQANMLSLVANGVNPQIAAIATLSQNYNSLNGILATTQSATNGATSAIGNSGNSLKQSNKQWSALALVVQDLPYGFRGIQNNLPALFGSLATGAGAAYFAFSAVVAVITAMDMGLIKFGNSVKLTTDYSKEAADTYATETVQLDSLYRVSQDVTVSMDDRLSAAQSLIKEYPGLLESYSAEDIALGKAAESYDKLREAVWAYAKVKAAEKVLIELGGKQNELTIKQNKVTAQQNKADIKALTAVNYAMYNNLSITEQFYKFVNDLPVNGAFGPIVNALPEMQKTTELLSGIKKEQEDLNDETKLYQDIIDNNIVFAKLFEDSKTGGKKGAKEKVDTSALDNLKTQQKIYKDDLDMFFYYGSLIINEEERIAKERARIEGTLGKELANIESNYEGQRIINKQEFGRKLMEQADKNTKSLENSEKESNAKILNDTKSFYDNLKLYSSDNLDQQIINLGLEQLAYDQLLDLKIISDTEYANKSAQIYKDLNDIKNKQDTALYKENIKNVQLALQQTLKATRGNYNAQKEAYQLAIDKLKEKKAALDAAGKSAVEYDNAINNLEAGMGGLVDPLEQLAQTLQSTFNQLNIDMLTAFGQQLGELMSGKEFDFTKLGTILADALSSIGKALIAYAVTNGAVAELFKNPATWPLAIAAGIAAVAAGSALKNKLSSQKATAFANGGIVSGPTMGLVGEYPGAANNPEVIAPLDKLKSMIGGGGGGTFVLRGQDLLLATNRAQKASNLKGQNISLA
jgi:uncharacterized protein YukE